MGKKYLAKIIEIDADDVDSKVEEIVDMIITGTGMNLATPSGEFEIDRGTFDAVHEEFTKNELAFLLIDHIVKNIEWYAESYGYMSGIKVPDEDEDDED